MVIKLKTWWKYSAFRFYIKNALWNYKFWIYSRPEYTNISYLKKNFFNVGQERINKRRFLGYKYKGKIYLDNPGLQNIEPEVWNVWKIKKLV